MPPRKGPRREKDPKPIFEGLTIAVACTLGETWTEVNMTRWITLRKGVFSPQMTAAVTHLVCSDAEAKAKVKSANVKEAIKRGSKTCKLVTKDWLEDSMHKDRRLPEKDFDPLRVARQAKKKELRMKAAAKGLREGKRTVDKNYYRHYVDETYFTYVVTLTRDDSEESGAKGERYVLCLDESIAQPRLYWFFVKYYKSKANTYAYAYVHRPTPHPGSFESQYEHFKAFFKTKTGISWDERLVKAGTPMDKKFFKYTPPTRGKPLGWVPPGFEKPDPSPEQPHAQAPPPTQAEGNSEEEEQEEEELHQPVGLEIMQLDLEDRHRQGKG